MSYRDRVPFVYWSCLGETGILLDMHRTSTGITRILHELYWTPTRRGLDKHRNIQECKNCTRTVQGRFRTHTPCTGSGQGLYTFDTRWPQLVGLTESILCSRCIASTSAIGDSRLGRLKLLKLHAICWYLNSVNYYCDMNWHHPFAYRHYLTNKNMLNYSFFPLTVVHWSILPSHIVQLNDVESFKQSLQSYPMSGYIAPTFWMCTNVFVFNCFNLVLVPMHICTYAWCT